MESLKVASGLFKYVNEVFLQGRQKASAGGKEANILSPITTADIGKVT